jgi:hypothetical protein
MQCLAFLILLPSQVERPSEILVLVNHFGQASKEGSCELRSLADENLKHGPDEINPRQELYFVGRKIEDDF